MYEGTFSVVVTRILVSVRVLRRGALAGHCEASGADETYTYCPNCGAIACDSHIRTERLEGDPVCTGCAVTERFALKTKYFYDEKNLDAFREEYAEMSLHEKAMENKLLAGASAVAMLLIVVGVLVIGGIV